MAQIDWSEFAVVESIGFTEEEEHGHVLPAPFTTIEEINAMLQAQAIQEQNLGIGANAGAGVRGTVVQPGCATKYDVFTLY